MIILWIIWKLLKTLNLGISNYETEEVEAMTQEAKEEVSDELAHEKKQCEKNDGKQSEKNGSRLGRDEPFEFGKRALTDESDVWDHNAWDNVDWGEEQIKDAMRKIEEQKSHPVSDFDKKLYNGNPARYWDIFYKNNRENFFKDRKWLQIEFPILYNSTRKNYGPVTIFEIGCGAGNTFFPILENNENEELTLVGADYAPKAVDLVRNSDKFDPRYGTVSVWDLANPDGTLPEGIQPHSVDIAVMIFVFSALSPSEWDTAMENLHKIMKPGGKILFREYSFGDMAQIRFKKNRFMEDNFYIRGDGTRVYFFKEEELREIFTKKNYFIENKIAIDRRLLVNRKRKLKMYRCWIQAIFDVPQ